MLQPLLNPLGFSAGDFIELALAALLVALVLLRARIIPAARKFAGRTGWCMLLLAVLPIALRLLLLRLRPIPTPGGADDFSYLLLADTLRHFRLANPPHPLHQFFEALFVLQEPAYSSIFPLGQGLALALGQTIFGDPWAGVVLSIAAFCSLCYWMLRGWTTPGWALIGGLLAAFEFGPLNQWMNTYWGGAVSAIAGCLVFGALPRLRQNAGRRNAVLLGAGLALQLLTRPFEFILLLVCVLLYFLPWQWRKLAIAAPVVAAAAVLTMFHNKAVTGSWTTLPYALSRYQYGVPAAFTVQPNAIPHRELTRQQQLDYDLQSSVHGAGADTFARYFQRLLYRMRFYRFFFLAPLYIALPAFLFTLRDFRFAWVLLSIVLFALGASFYPYLYPHYIAAIVCLLVLVSVVSLDRLSRFSPEAASAIIVLCAAHFLFWYGLHLLASNDTALSLARYEAWDYINIGDPEGRTAVNHQLAEIPGKLLVFVRYSPRHVFHEWIHNAADIDAARIVWAADLGPTEDDKLRHYYPDRMVWLLEPDAWPPKLSRYEPEPPPAEQPPPSRKPALQFEQVPKAR